VCGPYDKGGDECESLNPAPPTLPFPNLKGGGGVHVRIADMASLRTCAVKKEVFEVWIEIFDKEVFEMKIEIFQ
jgi:hypothetical protein